MIKQPDYPNSVEIFEVGPRDGLQNEPNFVPTDQKITFVNMLVKAGCKKVEVTSFVHPKWVPQLKDAEEVLAGIDKPKGVLFNALIPNMKGLERAIEVGLDEVVTIMSSSESHNKKNLNMSVDESLKQIEEINHVAREYHIRVRSYIGTAFGCPFEGDIPVEKMIDIARALESFGSYEVSLGDTTGMATPVTSFLVCSKIKEALTTTNTAAHFHRAKGIEFANNLAALQAGITIFDGAAGGLGGCPYAPGSTGNTATEFLVEMFEKMGIYTGIHQAKINECSTFAQEMIK